MRLLVAVDLLHSQARDVVGEAAEWAARLGGTLDVAFVDEYEYSAYLIPDPRVRDVVVGQWAQVRRHHEQALRELMLAVPEANRGDTRYLQGRASVVLVDVAEEYDGLVVATHGRRGLNHALMGSVAERLVRQVSVPVIVIRSPTAEPA